MTNLIRLLLVFFVTVTVAGFALSPCSARTSGVPGKKDARKLIQHLGGSSLSSGAVKILSISPFGAGSADCVAQLTVAFQFSRNDKHPWFVAEVRTADNHWEDVAPIADAIGDRTAALQVNDETSGNSANNDKLTADNARVLIARLLGLQLPKDQLQVGDIFVLSNSATAEATFQIEFRFEKIGGAWRIEQLRTSGNEWRRLEPIIAKVDGQKRERTRRELAELVVALEAYRRERGSYPIADSERTLIDHLAPLYLKSIVRVDPWHHDYDFHNVGSSYELRSLGPDGKPDTEDDIHVVGAVPEHSP